MKKKQLSLILAAAMFAACLNGCSKTEETEAPAETTTVEETTTEPPVMTLAEIPETEPAEQLPEGMMRSFLTGELVPIEVGTRRPVAFQVDNERLAMPQNGVGMAEVVYEVPIEADEVRMTAIIQDFTGIDRIGPLRSTRTYHPGIAAEFDAIFFHNGHSGYSTDQLNDPRCDDLEGIENSGWPAVYTSDDHTKGHNTFTTEEKTWKRIGELGFRTEMNPDFTYKFLFAADDETVTPMDGQNANKVSIGYWQNKPWFEFNAEDGLYYRFARGEKHIDEITGDQIAVNNIIVEYCDYELENDNNNKYIYTVGEGNGVFITNGQAAPITWSKPDYWGNTHYYYQNGEEITLNQGKTWVCIVLDDMTGEITVE